MKPAVINFYGGPLDGDQRTLPVLPPGTFPVKHVFGEGEEVLAIYKLDGFNAQAGQWKATYTYRQQPVPR